MSKEDSRVISEQLAMDIMSKISDNELVLSDKLDNLVKKTVQCIPQNENAFEEIIMEEVGIWIKDSKDEHGRFRRSLNKNTEFGRWAEVPIIEPKKTSKLRVALLGESVARGYFFDPHFNLAKALNSLFEGSSKQELDVIDLAKVSIELEELTLLTRQSLKLEPDVLVVFAGNNWFNAFRNKMSYLQTEMEEMNRIIDEHFHDSDIDGSYLDAYAYEHIEKYFREGIKNDVIAYLELLKEIHEDHAVQVIFVLPEYNILDWKTTQDEKSMCRKPLSIQKEWLTRKQRAEESFSKGNYKEVREIAETLIASDPSHPYGYNLMNDVEAVEGNLEGQYQQLGRARDTIIYNRCAGQARILTVIYDTIVEKYEQFGIHLVDLPKFFKSYLNGALPGRNLFIDYCHLNELGLQLTAGAIADELKVVFPQLKEDEHSNKSVPLEPEDNVKALAYLCAAVHNAHYGQHHDILKYLCKIGVATSHDLSIDFMKCFVDFSSRRWSNLICASHEKMVESETLSQYESGLGFLHTANKKLMDVHLVNVMTEILAEEGIDIAPEVKEVRKKNHGVNTRKINLLKSFYSRSSYDDASNSYGTFYRSANISSDFNLVAEANTELQLKLTYRTPGREFKNDKVALLLNDHCIVMLDQSMAWKTCEIGINANLVKDGVNILRICWPYQTPIHYKHFNDHSVNVTSVMNKILQVFGEIHAFEVRAV